MSGPNGNSVILNGHQRRRMRTLVREVKKQAGIIAKARDRIRKIANEAETYVEIADRAVDDLNSAADSLSEHL